MVVIYAEALAVNFLGNSANGAFMALKDQESVIVSLADSFSLLLSAFSALRSATIRLSRALAKFGEGFNPGAVFTTLAFFLLFHKKKVPLID
jgi:hypothetical protein